MKEKNIKFLGKDNKEYIISSIEKVFCEKYVEFRANGTKAVLSSGLKTKNRKSASTMASRILSKPHISQYLKSIASGKVTGTTKTMMVRKELAFLIKQRVDLNAKIRAIALYNKLTRRYPK